MSVEALSWAWRAEAPTPSSKLLLLALADAANEDGECWPRVATLAAKAGLSARHVKRILHELEERGLLIAAERFQGRQTSNLYRLSMRGDMGVTPDGARGDTRTTPGVTPASPPNHEPKVELKEGVSTHARETGQGNGFASFWETYPRKLHKAEAEKAWEQTRKTRPPTPQLLSKLTELAKTRQWQKNGGAFIPYPASWLRAGGWDDDPEALNGGADAITHGPANGGKFLPALAGLNPVDLERYRARSRRPQ